MDIIAIKELLHNKLGESCIVEMEVHDLQPALVVHRDFLLSICTELKDNPDTWFDFLSCISAVDYGETQGFGVVYHLASIPHKNQLTLKVKLGNERGEQLPWVDSVSEIWRTAEWHEREAFDLIGIYFKGHPDLRRILLPDDWQGYPLRKDYQDPEYYHGIPIK